MLAKHVFYIVSSCIFSLSMTPVAMAASIAGWGKVNMQGAIIDTACAISVDSREQTIDMDVIPLAEIIREGRGHSKPFSINLVDCVLERPGHDNDWKQFSVTFDGKAEGPFFGIDGEASGVSLQIIDDSGNIAIPGKALPLLDVTPGERQLNYTMRLVANNHALKSGDYFSSIRFKLDYF